MGIAMTETTSDPLAFADEQPDQTPQEAPREETLGDGIIGDTFGEDSSEGTGQPDEVEPETSPPPVRETPEEKAGRLRYEDYTRKNQEVAELRRQTESDRAELFRQQQEWVRQQQNPQQQQQAPLSQRLQALIQSPDLAEADRQGLGVVAQMAQTIEAQQQQLQEFAQFRQQFEPQFQQTAQALQQLTQRQQTELADKLAGEVNEAKRMFGEEAIQQSSGFIRHNYGLTNPKTNKPYSIAELTSMATGQPVKAVQKATQANRQVRTDAKRSVSVNGADTSTGDKNVLTKEEVLSNW